jgi:hypothetical protein
MEAVFSFEEKDLERAAVQYMSLCIILLRYKYKYKYKYSMRLLEQKIVHGFVVLTLPRSGGRSWDLRINERMEKEEIKRDSPGEYGYLYDN